MARGSNFGGAAALMRSLTHSTSRAAVALAAGFVLWLASAQGLLAAGPQDRAELLLPALIAMIAATASAFLHVDFRRWPIEASLFGATAATLGPLWASGLTVGCLVARWCVSAEVDLRRAWGLELAAAAIAGLAAFPLSGWYAGGAFVVVWLLVRRTPVAPMLPLAGAGLIVAGLEVTLGSAGLFWGLPLVALLLAVGAEETRDRRDIHTTLQALALMLQRAHPYTHAHIERVARVAERTALRLGLSPARSQLVHRAARLHDVGKIAIDERVLDKPGALSAEEYAHVKLHAPYGAAILEEIEDLRTIAEWIRCHHERPDGKGYPRGLKGNEIPLEARIIAAADAFDAMTGGFLEGEKRPYRDPISPVEALRELERCAGTQFDAQVVAAFKSALYEEVRR